MALPSLKPTRRPAQPAPEPAGTVARFDADALSARLSGLAGDRAAVIEAFRDTLQLGLADIRHAFSRGRAGGLDTARAIAGLHHDLVRAVWDHVTRDLHPNANPTPGERVALCAVGGFGRGEMAPHSDIDLLFVVADRNPSAHAEQVTEAVLYLLWDLGLSVGHAVRTPAQCVELARSDQTILTSLLDLRHLAGDHELSDAVYARLQGHIAKTRNRAYIADKLAERDARHAAQGNSRYQIEPNIKEGKGGLRDLHVLYWIATFLDNLDGELEDANDGARYVALGLFDERAAQRFARASDFLWRTRIHLHWLAGRAQEQLSFDAQTKLCREMGYASGPIEEAVERFMREYFTNAREVGALTRIACAKLEEQEAIRVPLGLDALLPGNRRNMRNTSFRLRKGRLDFRDALSIRERPAQIMELFEIAGRRNLDIHPDAFQAIDYRRNLIDADFRRDPAISATFQKLLLGAKVPGAVLRVMNEAGVLGRYLLEFGGIVARTQFNMHHAYTVDEHTLRLVSDLNDIETGELADAHPISTAIARELTREQRLALYLACLLHDTGKGVGDQCVEGARLARRACRRLGVPQTVTDDVAWLVRRHLDLSETAQRRDLSDPDTIRAFAARVGSVERLDMLLLLTVVDIRSVGPGIWNDWKATLLRELYGRTRDVLDGAGEDYAPGARAASLREQLLERLPGEMAGRVRAIVEDLPDSYWERADMEGFVRHARFFDQAVEAGEDMRVHTRRDRPRDITEAWVLARDRDGLFADLTLAIAASGAQVTGARLSTTESGRVFNVFYLQNANGHAFGRRDDDKLSGLRESVARAAAGDVSGLSAPVARSSRRAAAIPIRARARVLHAERGCIVEIAGRDRPGLLHAIADVLRAHGLPVLSAHVEVEGPKAIDAFYLGACPASESRLRRDLMGVLAADRVAA